MQEGKGVGALPVKKRIVELDALRGFALLGIALANFPEFSLWTFLDEGARAVLPHAGADPALRFLQYMLVDGKFYTVFSVLFGIGFTITIDNAVRRGADWKRIFYRRMAGLAVIGFLHLMFVWSGDILLLYALMGMLLPLFYKCSQKTVLRWSAFFLAVPVVISALRSVCGIDPSDALYDAWWDKAAAVGIGADNFATWLRDARTYGDVFRFLRQGAVERMWEFVSGMRYFKVLGLFLFGFWLGRGKVHGRLVELKPTMRKIGTICLAAGLPLSFIYALASTRGCTPVAKEAIYAAGVYPLALAYMCGFLLLVIGKEPASLPVKTARALACSGKMALSSYLFQSVMGIVLFYGIGFGLGAGMTLWQTELVALGAFLLETGLCMLWLRRFAFGPVEWLWRIWNYGRFFPIRRTE